MKDKSYIVLALVLLVVALVPVPLPKRAAKIKKAVPVLDAAQKAAHMLLFKDGLCSSVAVGPHALMTAEHCNYGPHAESSVRVDLWPHEYTIVETLRDDRDHIIFLLDGPAFKHPVKYDPARKDLTVGTNVTFFGDGEGEYPPVKKSGFVLETEDRSEVDEAQQFRELTNTAIPGDSGSGVFTDDGQLVAVVTYKMRYDRSGVFQLAFTAAQMKHAETFDGKKKIPNAHRPFQSPVDEFYTRAASTAFLLPWKGGVSSHSSK